MRVRFRGLRLAMVAYVFCLVPNTGLAQDMTVDAIRAATPVDVPLVLGDVDTSTAGSTLWTKGDRPANPLLARLTVRPVEAAVMTLEEGEVVLWRAFASGETLNLTAEDVDLTGGPRIFCATMPGRDGPGCFIDAEGDGRFDQTAEPVTERGRKPYHVTILKRVQSLTAPLPYRLLAAAQRPALTVNLNNCAKDYDRPRFSALSTSDRNAPVITPLGWHAKDSSLAICRRAPQRAAAADAANTVPAGGYLAEIGPLLFTVGTRNDPRLTLVGPVAAGTLFRLEGDSLVELGVGRTPAQAQLIALKKFPYPVLMTDAGAVIEKGPIAPGGRLAVLPFHHGYRGVLTRDVAIATLLGKRSVAAGTILYGFPAESSITYTVNGIPDHGAVEDNAYRRIRRELTWCAPVKGQEPEKPKAGAITRNGWSAACVPYSNLGNHTVLTDRSPAFAVTSLSYNVATSSNDGPPPVRRDDSATFAQPLRLDYVYQGRDGEFITLLENIHSGDELTSSKPVKLYAPADTVGALIAGVPVELATTDDGMLTVTAMTQPVIGSNPVLKWDERAFLLQQLAKMGLRPADAEAAEAGTLEGAQE